MSYLSENTKFLRDVNNWSQGELAKRVSKLFGKKVSQQSIEQIESGMVKHPKYRPELAECLGVSVDDLYNKKLSGRKSANTKPQKTTSTTLTERDKETLIQAALLVKEWHIETGRKPSAAQTTNEILAIYNRLLDDPLLGGKSINEVIEEMSDA